MSQPSLVVPVVDLESGPKEVTFTLSEAWLGEVLEPAGATALGPGTLSLELTKHGSDVMVRGHATLSVSVPCVVTLDPLTFELRPEIFLLLRQGPKSAEPARHRALRGAAAQKEANEPPGPKRQKRKREVEEEPELTAEEAARDTFQGDEIVLDGFVREFVLLELPLYPRRPDLPSPEESIVSRPLAGLTGDPRPIDPRLAPLAQIAKRLKNGSN